MTKIKEMDHTIFKITQIIRNNIILLRKKRYSLEITNRFESFFNAYLNDAVIKNLRLKKNDAKIYYEAEMTAQGVSIILKNKPIEMNLLSLFCKGIFFEILSEVRKK